MQKMTSEGEIKNAINERKNKAKNEAYNALMSNDLHYSECCEVLEDLLKHFRFLTNKYTTINKITEPEVRD